MHTESQVVRATPNVSYGPYPDCGGTWLDILWPKMRPFDLIHPSFLYILVGVTVAGITVFWCEWIKAVLVSIHMQMQKARGGEEVISRAIDVHQLTLSGHFPNWFVEEL